VSFADLLAVSDRLIRVSLGESVVYTSGAGVAVPVVGIFDEPDVTADLGTPGVASQGPRVALTVADLSSDPDADSAATVTRTLTGKTYVAHDAKPDGIGMVVLFLHETT
jgi:hypothetical protein